MERGAETEETRERARVELIEVEELRARLGGDDPPVVIDVREQVEWRGALGHIAGAKLVPLSRFLGGLSSLTALRDTPVVIVCRSGHRSRLAGMLLVRAGFRSVASLEGGMLEWNARGYPRERSIP